MSGEIQFQEDFINSIDLLKRDIDRTLIYTIHLLYSSKVDTGLKQQYCLRLGKIAQELHNQIIKFDAKKITPYDIRERENSFLFASKNLHLRFHDFISDVEQTDGIIIDKKVFFSISDILLKLNTNKVYTEYSLTKDKIDNLLSIKDFIVDIYKSQIATTIKQNKSLDKQFLELKEKTYLSFIRNSSNKNPLYMFRSIELLKKFSNEGSGVHIWNDDNPIKGKEIGIKIIGEKVFLLNIAIMALRLKYLLKNKILKVVIAI